ncbi:MAG: DUF1501 domain-containing protein [Planctomycetes bacterium]|jgi:uncharacterized protein (DUF1501 family)|nr:DUF1501 domain-containing protein [Planctomycetota bacterium]
MLTRRDFLKAGAVTALGFRHTPCDSASAAPWLQASVAADTKLVLIFQRGGNDGVNTLIPYGDPQYSAANRPTLFIPRASAIDLGNDFAGLHPRMAPIMDLYHHRDLDGVDGPGNLALIHRVGYPGQSQSHFDGQQYWETGVPGKPAFEEGMLYRQMALTMRPETNRLAAVAISGTKIMALTGPQAVPTVRDPAAFTFSGSAARTRKLLGQLPSVPQGSDGSGLLGAYGGPRDFPEKPYRELVYGTGLVLMDAMQIIREAVAQGPYVPSGDAAYPSGDLGTKLTHAALLLKRTPVRLVALNMGGWDTHANQGQINGTHGGLLAQVAQGYQALYRDLREQWDKLIVVTVTEFGRTSRENGGRGTDHAQACVMLAAGGRVRGGVYNCDAATWQPGDLFSAQDRYIRRRTDFRTVFAEIFTRHFGSDPATLEAVIPGYAQAVLASPQDFLPLNFLV